MRINKFVAAATGLSRRAADEAIKAGRIRVNGELASLGLEVSGTAEAITLDGHPLRPPETATTIMLNKPAGYVCSRRGQGSQTIYDLLPAGYAKLKPVGRLDKESSGLILLTSDGGLAQQLTHPSNRKVKVYDVALDRPLQPLHQQIVSDKGIALEDGPSRLGLEKLDESARHWRITMREGRNRQIRRTFAALGYEVVRLHRTKFGPFSLDALKPGEFCTAHP